MKNRMIRILCRTFLVCILSLMPALSVTASDDHLIDDIYTEEEYQKAVEEIMAESSQLDEAYRYENTELCSGYMFHYIGAEAFQKELAPAEDITKLISVRTDWTVTTTNDFYYHVYEINGERGVGIGDYSSSICDWKTIESSFVDLEAVKDTVLERVQTDGELRIKPVCIYVTAYDTCFVYFKTGTASYVIPYAISPQFTGLNNGECYSFDEAATAAEKAYPLSEMDKSLAGGGFTENKKTGIIHYSIITFIIAAVLISAGGILYFFTRSPMLNRGRQ